MEEFKIKSLDDFDSMFMSSKNAAPKAPVAPAAEPVQAPVQPAAPINNAPVQPVAPAPAPKKESLIPEMETGPVEINFFEIDGVPAGAAPAAQKPASNVYSAAPVSQNYGEDNSSSFNPAPKAAQPPVSLYQAESMNNGGIQQFLYQPKEGYSEDEDYEEDEESANGGVLPMVGKIVSIVMLAITLLAFVLGCFVTIFLNNKDSKCGKICFATVAEDAVDGFGVKKGSLIICKSVDIEEYEENASVAVPTNVEGCKLYQVISVDKDQKYITVADPSGDSNASQTYTLEDIYGLATFNLGGLGKVIQFASNNSILVCILFLLLAALWCLCIILIEKSQENKDTEEDEEEDLSDNGGLSF